MARVHLDERHPSLRGLVGEVLSELMEGPGGEGVPLVAAKPYPLADAAELLDGDAATGAPPLP
jgi:hypothetical protein